MTSDVAALRDRYWRWLRDETSLRQIGEWAEITTPYLDRHNDCLQIYVRQQNGGFVLTDDGYTIEDLELSGCAIDGARREGLLRTTLNGFGVEFNAETKALEVRASAEDFGRRKHNLVQAMLAINDIFYVVSPAPGRSLFFEEVGDWLDDADVRYTPHVTFTGKSGYIHRFDFVIPKSRKRPERVMRAINRPQREAAQRMTFAWMDTREVRSAESCAYAILNDLERPVPRQVLDAMRSYDVSPITWSDRERVRDELAA